MLDSPIQRKTPVLTFNTPGNDTVDDSVNQTFDSQADSVNNLADTVEMDKTLDGQM